MMKIHKTQNLTSFAQLQPTQYVSQSKELRSNNSSLENPNEPKGDSFVHNVSFGKRIPFNKIVKQTAEKAEKIAEVNKKIAANKGKDPVGGKVNKFLEKTTEQEVVITAVVSAVLAGIARPLTLMMMANDKDKNDMAYASAHAISSAIFGFIVPFLFIRPLARGYNNALKNIHEHLTPNEIKEWYPHWNEKDPRNWINGVVGDMNKKGLIKPMSEAFDHCGNKLVTDIKDVYKVALPKHSTEISKETYAKFFGENGEVKSLKDVYVALIDESKAENLSRERSFWDKLLNRKTLPKYYELDQCTEGIWKEAFPNIDVKTIGEAGKRDLSKMRNIDGTPFVLDKSMCYVSDWTETNKSIPYSLGETFDYRKVSLFSSKNKKSKKDVCYQKNGPDHGRGTPIDEEMTKKAGINEVHNKFGGWLPDIVIAYPRAAATIAIIPFVLKNVFHLEKKKKSAPVQEVAVKNAKPAGKEVA